MKGAIFIVNVFIVFGALAQSKHKVTLSASLNPTITYCINTSSSSAIVPDQTSSITYKEFADSIKSFETFKTSLGATVWMNYPLNVKWTLQAGLGYSEVGFTREQKDIHLGDVLFPGVGSGVLEENSNSTKNIAYKFRYQYLTVPVLFNYYGKRSRDFKWSYYFTTGAAMNILVNDQIKAKLDNFYVEGEKVYKIDSTGYEGNRITMNLFVGGKFEYKVKTGLSVFGQPMITIFPFSVSQTEMKSRPIGLQVNCGITYDFSGPLKDE
jgi:hypothetical protein